MFKSLHTKKQVYCEELYFATLEVEASKFGHCDDIIRFYFSDCLKKIRCFDADAKVFFVPEVCSKGVIALHGFILMKSMADLKPLIVNGERYISILHDEFFEFPFWSFGLAGFLKINDMYEFFPYLARYLAWGDGLRLTNCRGGRFELCGYLSSMNSYWDDYYEKYIEKHFGLPTTGIKCGCCYISEEFIAQHLNDENKRN